jgi:two-component system chemotaxis response regulator CheY
MNAIPFCDAHVPPASERHCLIVDDSRVVRKVARRILETHGFKIEEAENGAEAMIVCRRGLPRCILLDWNMPVMNGIEFLQALRAEFGAAGPLVVFCTTENDVASIAAAIEHGAQEYIMKPFDEEILVGKFTQVGLL